MQERIKFGLSKRKHSKTDKPQAHQSNKEDWHNKGVNFELQKKYAQAIDCYNNVLEIYPNDKDAWFNKGAIFEIQKQYAEAINCYDKVLQIDKSDEDALRHKSKIEALLTTELKTNLSHPTPSAPPPGTNTLQNIVVPSAPQMGTQTLHSLRHEVPSVFQNTQSYYAPPVRTSAPQTVTRSLVPSAPVISEQTQQFLMQKNPSHNNNFDEIALDDNQIIARGGFGFIYRTQWNQTIVAVKTTNNVEQLDSIKKEYDMLSKLEHPNLVHIHGCFTRNNIGFCLVMDFYANSSLNQYLYAPQIWNNSMPWRLRCSIEVTQGLIFLHENNLLHLDLKPENVLVREDWHVVITDFGISRKLAVNQTHQTTMSAMGTPAFTAPEIIAPKNSDGKTRYDRSNDIYSLAVLLWCCVAQKKPFDGWDNMRIMLKVTAKRNNREEMPEGTPRKLAKLIRQCWAQTPSSRPIAASVHAELGSIYAKEPNKNSVPMKK